MKLLNNLISTLIAWGAGISPKRPWVTHDSNQTAIKFRMNAGFAGDVNRVHPFSVESVFASAQTLFGQFVKLDGANGVKPFAIADASDVTPAFAWGLVVRPYPTQQTTGGMTSSFNTGSPAATGVIDVLRDGYAMATLNDVTATPKKGDPVFLWCAATAGVHVLGGVEAVFSAGNTVELANAQFNGPADPSGNVEIIVGKGKQL